MHGDRVAQGRQELSASMSAWDRGVRDVEQRTYLPLSLGGEEVPSRCGHGLVGQTALDEQSLDERDGCVHAKRRQWERRDREGVLAMSGKDADTLAFEGRHVRSLGCVR